MTQHGVPAGEGLATLVANKGSWNKVGIMVALEVHIQKLLLPECFITLAAGKRLLPSVCALVHYHMAFLSTAVVTLITLETFLILVGLLVLDECVPLMKHSVTVTTFLSCLNKRVLLPQVNTKVTLACDDSITVWAVELSHILCVFLQNMHLHGAALRETGMADVALVWLFT